MSTRREFLLHTAAAGVAAAAPGLGSTRESQSPSVLKSALKTYRIPHTELTITRLGFGCAMLGTDWNDPDFVAKSVPVIHTACEQGITFLDVADIYGYGKAELALAQVFKQRPGLRNKLVIQSKCGDRFKEGGVVDNSYQHIISSVEGSLGRLDTEHLDVLLLHWPDSLVEPHEVAKAFDELHRSGKVRYFGVSNHNPTQIELLRKVVRQPLVVNQIQLGLAHWVTVPESFKGSLTHGDEGVSTLDYCRLHEIQVQAYSPLRGSRLGKPLNLLNPDADASEEVKHAAQMLADLAKTNDVSPAAIMLAWLLRHPAGIVPIFGANKSEYVVDNCKADGVELSRVEWYTLLHAVTQAQAPQRT